MGADVHVVLGRINIKAIADRRDVPASNCTALALFGEGNFQGDDFTLMDVPDEYDLWRNYALFAWLSGVRGDLKPIDPEGKRQDLTNQFLEWLDQKWIEAEMAGARDAQYSYGFACGRDSVNDTYDTGDHSRIIHTVPFLRNFNYDQVAEVRDHQHPDDTWDNPIYIKPTEADAMTYRDYFGDRYFTFLDFCVREQWHFVLFGFDS